MWIRPITVLTCALVLCLALCAGAHAADKVNPPAKRPMLKAFYGTVVKQVQDQPRVLEFRLGSRGPSLGTLDVSKATIVVEKGVPFDEVPNGRHITVVAGTPLGETLPVMILYLSNCDITVKPGKRAYLNGTYDAANRALVLPDGTRHSLEVNDKTMIIISVPGTVADVNTENKFVVFADLDAKAQAPADHVASRIMVLWQRRGHKAYSGLHRASSLPKEAIMEKEVYRADFAKRPDEWKLVSSNKKSKMEVVDGNLRIEGHQDATVWLTSRTLDGDFRIRMRAKTIGEERQGNINLIFLLWCQDGVDPLNAKLEAKDHKRAFQDKARGYMATLTQKWCRLRRNPGYQLVSDRPEVQVKHGEEHLIEVTRVGKRVIYRLDGLIIHDYTDAELLGPGRLALRTWSTTLDILELTVTKP